MSLQVRAYEGISALDHHSQAWEELLERSGNPSFFLRATWLKTWAKHWLGKRRFMLAIVERDGNWIGGLPLVLGRGKIGARWNVRKLEFAGAPYFDRMELPAENAGDCRQALEVLITWAKQELGSWTAMGLHEIPNGSDTMNAFRYIAADQGAELHTVLASKAPMVDLHTKGNTSSKYRRQLRQSMEQLETHGVVTTDFFHVAAKDVDSLVDECALIEGSSWKGEQGVGIFRDLAHKNFVGDLWKTLAADNGVAIATIRLDGELIIYHWGFRHCGRFLSYNMAQRPDTNKLRGGSLVLRLMVENGNKLGFDAIDASRGSLTSPNVIGRYHGPVRDHGNVVLYGPNLAGATLSTIRHRVLPAWRKLRSKPDPPQLEDKETITDLPCTNESA